MRLLRLRFAMIQILFIALALSGLTVRAFCYSADVTDVSGTKYFPAVKEAIAGAEKSISVVMFTIESSLTRLDSKPNQLIDDLIKAGKRGVAVEVILDQNIDFVRGTHAQRLENKVKSTLAYKRLKDAGIKVNYDDSARYTHAKAVVIDRKTVILGSTNWTESSFDNNIETDVMIVSEKLAEEILGYLKTVKIDSKVDEYLDSIGPSVLVSREFMENPKLAPFLVSDQAERAFDIYLYLLWKFDGNAQGRLNLFYDELAKYLGIYDGWTVTDFRRQITKALRKMEAKYKLIKFEPRYAKEAGITLLGYGDVPGIYGVPEDGYFELPVDYFNLRWNRELSLRAKFCYLINLASTETSDFKPWWSKSVNTIIEQFGGIGQDVINKGMGELRKANLLAVQYDDLSGKLYDQRRPKMYKLLKLYNPQERALKLKGLEDKYGKEEYARARKYAGIVFEENNPDVLEDIIARIKEFGPKEVERVFGEVARKNIDNPKRNYVYVTRIMGRDEDGKDK